MNICKEKGHIVPFDENCFENIKYQKPTEKSHMRLREGWNIAERFS